MPVVERSYIVPVGELGKEVATPLTVRFVSPDKDHLDWLVVNFPKLFGDDIVQLHQCPHTHGQEKGCSCKRQCQRTAGHSGNHYYAWGKLGREIMNRDLEEAKKHAVKQILCMKCSVGVGRLYMAMVEEDKRDRTETYRCQACGATVKVLL